MKPCGEHLMLQDQAARETGKDRPVTATRSRLASKPSDLWATPRTITGGGESLERKQQLGRTESGGGDLQAQSEQQWQTPATDSFRSRGGLAKTKWGSTSRPESHGRAQPTGTTEAPIYCPIRNGGGASKGEQLNNFVSHQLERLMWPTIRSHEVGEYQNQTDGTTQPTLTGSAQHHSSLQDQPTVGPGPNSSPKTGASRLQPAVSTGSWMLLDVLVYHSMAYRAHQKLWAVPYVRPALRQRLNPGFVDALMSWPPSWTSVRTACGPAAMELWRSRVLRHLESL